MLSFLPAALLTAHKFLWVQWSVFGHQPCPHSQGTPRFPQPTVAQPQAQPCHAQGWLPGAPGASLLCFQRILLSSSLPLPALPYLSVMSTSLQKLGKTSDVCRLAYSLFVKSPCVSCQMDRKGLLPPPGSAAPCCPQVSHLPGTHCCSLCLQVHTAVTWIPASFYFCSLYKLRVQGLS